LADEIDRAIRKNARDMTRGDYDYAAGGNIPPYKPTEAERAELHVVTLRNWGHRQAPYALNAKLWDKLQAEWRKKYVARKKTGKNGAAGGEKGEKKKPPTAAQIAAREKEQAEQFAERLERWRIDWYRYLIAAALAGDAALEKSYLRLVLYFATTPPDARYGSGRDRGLADRAKALAAAAKAREVRCEMAGPSYDRRLVTWSAIADRVLDGLDQMAALVRDWLRAQFWDPAANAAALWVPADDVEAIAGFLEVDPHAAWRSAQAGPLSEDYWELHTKEQLHGLGEELGVHLPPTKPKSVMVDLLKGRTGLALPEELRPAAARKRKSGKGK
jgi:hypothetical protein